MVYIWYITQILVNKKAYIPHITLYLRENMKFKEKNWEIISTKIDENNNLQGKKDKNTMQYELRILRKFLEIPVSQSNQVFTLFSDLNADDTIQRGSGLERFIYIRGNRKNKVLLVAHADTVWDVNYLHKTQKQNELILKDNTIYSFSNEHGIGADDRAGCAIIYLLQKLGHSILITNGEEHGRIGSKWLMNSIENRDIACEINNDHNFVIQFDRRNSSDYKCYDVGTVEFSEYVEKSTGYSEPDRFSFTDIVTLCKSIPGVNLSVGYYHEHTKNEILNIADWRKTLNICKNWLSNMELPKFNLNNYRKINIDT